MGHEQYTPEDIIPRLKAGTERFAALEAGQEAILKAINEIKDDVAATKEIVEAWSTAKNVARFVKWLSGIAGGIIAIWVLAKAMAKGLI